MAEDASQSDDSNRTAQRISIRLVLGVLLGLYLAGYCIYRLNNEPPRYIWLGFYDRGPNLKEYLEPFEDIWKSGEPVGMKLFHTLYTPCYVTENWMIDKVLQ